MGREEKPWRAKRAAEGANMEVVEHLDELRDRLIASMVALVAAVVLVGIPFNGPIMAILMRPLQSLPEPEAKGYLRIEVGEDGSLRLAPASFQRLMASLAPSSTTGALLHSALPPDLVRTQVELALPDGRSTLIGTDFRNQLFFFTPIEPFLMKLRLAMLIGFIVALPFVLYQAWAFVAPGLTAVEQTFLRRIFGMASVLFPIGAAFAYFFMAYALFFLFRYGGDFIPAISVKSYFGFMLMMMLVMGVVFQCPLVVLGLVRFGIIPLDAFQRNRPLILLGLVVVSAIVTPPDPFTMMLMAVPLWMLFEASLVVARIMTVKSPAIEGAAGPSPHA